MPQTTARQIALQYLSLVAPHDYDGGPISVDRCPSENTSPRCKYIVSHWGNGCGWGSEVSEICDDERCRYEFTPYDDMPVCE